MGLDFDVTPAVLIPRPETEGLVELVISRMSEITNPTPLAPRPSPLVGRERMPSAPPDTQPPCKDEGCRGDAGAAEQRPYRHLGCPASSGPVSSVPSRGARGEGRGAIPVSLADIGTGSGAIALSLAHYLPDSHIFAVDISPEALAVAQGNAAHLGVADRVTFLLGDLLAPLRDARLPGVLHAIVSNPPYIPRAVIPTLDAHVQAEPHLALDGGLDGLDFYRRLAAGSGDYLLPGGLLAVEVGHHQAEQVAALFAASGYEDVEIHKDLAGIGRVVIASKPSASTSHQASGISHQLG